MPRRQWGSWPRRFGTALTETSGIVGLVGVGITAVGATVAAPVLLAVGGVAVGGALLYAGYRGMPPKMLAAAELVGSNFPLSKLETISPPVLRLGIVGYTQAGKTTFLRQALQQQWTPSRTNRVYATIIALQTKPTMYVALLDGDGVQLPQQFEIAESADFLIVFVDHNRGDDSISKSNERANEHDRFLQQLEFHLKRRNRIGHLHLVLNKRDLWERSKSAAELRTWFQEHVQQWERANVASRITADIHSNLLAADIGKVLRLISEAATSHEKQ